MSQLTDKLAAAETVAIMGHIRPDGDCIGSCLALYNYIREQCPSVEAKVYLEQPADKFDYLQGFGDICSDFEEERSYDLCVCLDCSDRARFGPFVKYLDAAADSLCIDHHITNLNFAAVNIVESNASSTCEVLFGQLEEAKIDKAVAECLYTGIIHDTGVFKFSCTSASTMRAAGFLMEKGIDFTSIIDDSFYTKTYIQNQVLGRALLESVSFMDGRCIFSVVRKQDMEFYGVESKDLDGIIEQLRITRGVECAIFLYEVGIREYKVSLRSNTNLDVSRIASYFGGGGHVKAAGCTMSGSIHDVINNLSSHIEAQMNQENGNV